MDGAISFAERLRHHRELRGLTQEELAEAAGLTPRAIGALERGERRSPYPHTVRALAAALDLASEEQRLLLRAARPGAGSTATVVAAQGLCAPSARLLGRADELAAADLLLRSPDIRLLTLTGPGGVGKTRLALQVAVDASSQFDDVVVVPLASLTAASHVPAAIARALSLPDAGGGVLAGILAALRDRAVLLLLDNFEHVLAAVPHVAELLDGCVRLKVLATSRAALGSRYEQQFPVPPLAVPAADDQAAGCDLLAYPSVQLFVDRMRAVDPIGGLDPEDVAAVAAICRCLDGLPLAIELAAARTRVLSPRMMVTRLSNHLDLLTGGPCDVPTRQRTMRSTIAWSHDLLTADERRAFRRLAVFIGGFTLEAAEWVTGLGSRMLNLVDSLTSQNLVLREHVADGGLRFRMPEPVREFGQEQLEASGEADAIGATHVAWCMSLAEEGDRALLGPEQRHWQERLEIEHANMRSALGWLRDRGDVNTAVRLAVTLARFWWCHGHYGAGRKELETLLAFPGEAVAMPWRAAAMGWLGAMLHKMGEYTSAVRQHEAAVVAWRGLDVPTGLAQGLWGLGFTLTSIDLAAAEPVFSESLALARAHGPDWYAAASLWGLGVSAHALGMTRRAADLLGQALTDIRRIGNPLGIAATLQTLGQVEWDLGNPARAMALLTEALRLYRDISVPWGIVGCLEDLAFLTHANGQLERAVRLYGAAAALREAVGLSCVPTNGLLSAQTLADARDTLGAARFARIWSEGQALPSAEAVAYALAADGPD